MPVVNQVITLAQAIQRSLATWDVIIKPFGSGDDLTYPSLALQEAGLPSFNAVAIGPRSTIDRCWVLWDPQVLIDVRTPPAKTASPDFYRRLSVGAPLSFPQIGNEKVPATTLQAINPVAAVRFGAEANAFSSTSVTNRDDLGSVRIPGTFRPQANGSLTPIAPTMATDPQLHLVFYLGSAIVSPPPLQRYPYHETIDFGLGSASPPTSSYGISFPVHGRKHIRLVFEIDPLNPTSVYTATVGGMISRQSATGVPSDVVLGTVAAVSSGVSRTLTFDNPGVDYLNIYSQASVASGNGRVTCFAYD